MRMNREQVKRTCKVAGSGWNGIMHGMAFMVAL